MAMVRLTKMKLQTLPTRNAGGKNVCLYGDAASKMAIKCAVALEQPGDRKSARRKGPRCDVTLKSLLFQWQRFYDGTNRVKRFLEA